MPDLFNLSQASNCSFLLSKNQRMSIALALAVQGPLVAYMIAGGWSSYALCLGFSLILARGAYDWLKKSRSLTQAHGVFMLAFGNLGMLIGWLADFGFRPLLGSGVCLCGCADSSLGAGLCCQCVWMYSLMYAGCLPCLFIEPFKTHCSKISLLLAMAGMGLGMFALTYLISLLPILHPTVHFFLTLIGMMLGMTLGEKIPQALISSFRIGIRLLEHERA